MIIMPAFQAGDEGLIPSTRSIAMTKSINIVKIYLLLWLAVSISGFVWVWKINLDYSAMGRPSSNMAVGMMSVMIAIPSFISLLLSSIGLIFAKMQRLAVIMLGLMGTICFIALPWLSLCIAGSAAVVYRLGRSTTAK